MLTDVKYHPPTHPRWEQAILTCVCVLLQESVVLGQFVVRQVWDELNNQVAGGLVVGGLQVSHLAHLGGGSLLSPLCCGFEHLAHLGGSSLLSLLCCGFAGIWVRGTV